MNEAAGVFDLRLYIVIGDQLTLSGAPMKETSVVFWGAAEMTAIH
jgi:hypothetical protein